MKFIINFTVCVLIFISVIGFIPLQGEGKLYDNVIRLHVVANSDSTEDQELKLLVRDEVLSRFGESLRGYASFAEARDALQFILADIERESENVVSEYGYSYTVSAFIEEEYYPECVYDNFSLPAGNYTSLRIKIGEGEGKNWWCVLFPPLCVSAALKDGDTEAERKFISAGFTPEQYKIITESETPRYRLKFKIVEIFESLFSHK